VYIIRAPKYERLHRENRAIPVYTRYFQFLSELKIDFQMTDDTLAIQSHEDGIPLSLLIQHRPIVEGFRALFEEIWTSSKPFPQTSLEKDGED
jgi:hypothetical protein